jgi:hypothetical protein
MWRQPSNTLTRKAFEAAEFSAPCKVLGCAAPLKGKMKLICETF